MARRVRLSIVLSCYTKSPWYQEALESILNGHHMRDTEIILCDDASPLDGGEGVTAREYAKKYPDLIRTFRNGERNGIAKSYSRLLAEAKGEFFMPFDSDDIFVPFDLDGSMDFLDANRDYAATYGKKRLFNASDGDLFCCYGGDLSLFAMHLDPRITHNGMVIRTEDLRDVGGYQETTLGVDTAMADIYMWTRLAARKKIIYFNQIRAFYRVHGQQFSQTRFETYPNEYSYVAGKLREANSEMYENMRNFRDIWVDDSNRSTAAMLLGGMFREEQDESTKLVIASIATHVIPEDYGVYEHRANYLLHLGRPQQALEDVAQLLLCIPDSLYVRSIGSRIGEVAMEMAQQNKSLFTLAFQRALHRFFEMSPEQTQLLHRTLAHARANS